MNLKEKGRRYDRLIKLTAACAMCCDDDKLTLYAGSKTFGGKAIENLMSELHLRLSGMDPIEKCKEIK